MSKCKDCKYYDDTKTYAGTGYCQMHDDYVREDEICEDFEEELE